jgi:hypothetical protein
MIVQRTVWHSDPRQYKELEVKLTWKDLWSLIRGHKLTVEQHQQYERLIVKREKDPTK